MSEVVSWADGEAPQCAWLDPRESRNAVRMLERLCDNAGASLSQALGNDGRQAARRLLKDERMTVDEGLSGHYAETAQRCSEHALVLIAQDTTEIDYGSHRVSKPDLGPMSGPGSWGVLAHSALAMTEEGLPLGTLHLALWARDPEQLGKKHDRREKTTSEKESSKWLNALASIEARLPEEQRALVIADSESDVYDYFACPHRATVDLLLRACQPRRVVAEGARGWERLGTLFDLGQNALELGALTVVVPRKLGKAEREAHLKLASMRVHIARPADRKLETLAPHIELTLVHAWEPSAPEGEEAIEWWLLTTLEVSDEASARRVVGYYARRWQIEVLHKVLKTGLGVERLQVTEAGHVMNVLAQYWIVAWRILWLTHIARTDPEKPAEEVLPEDELEVLRALTRKPVTTAADVVTAVARLGGHEPYKNGPPPGPKRLWEGLRRIHDMLLGWRLARAAPDL